MTALTRIMKYELRIMVSVILSMILASLFMIHPVYAQSLTPLPPTVSPVSPLYTDMIVYNLFHSFSCIAVGQSVIGQPCLTYQISQNAQGMIQGVPMLSSVNTTGGTLNALTSVIDLMYANPPVRTADYLASVEQGLGIVKEAHAQVTGSGAAVLNPILALWQTSRNISYVLMIIIFLIIGLMVMFRNKINPQTVITAQAALPGLVIGLIMITFSYFFAALLVDTAFIGTNIVGAYFSAAQKGGSSNLVEDLKQQNVLSIMSTFIGSAGIPDINPAVDNVISQLGPDPGMIISAVAAFLSYTYASQFSSVPVAGVSAVGCSALAGAGTLTPGTLLGIPAMTWSNVPNCIHNATIVGQQAAGAIAAAAALASPASVISMALYVILIAVLIYTMFKLLIRLVTCFLTIILFTITAPFQFLFASLPGRQGIATGWILDILANVLAFPAVIAVLYFVNFLLGSQARGFVTNKPPFPVTGGPLDLISNGALPLFGDFNIGFIRLLLAFGALMATPSIPDIISKTIGRVSQAGQMIGQEIGGGMRSGQGYIDQARQGVGALNQGVESLYDQPGWVKDTTTNRWTKQYGQLSGARPGLGSQIRGIFRR